MKELQNIQRFALVFAILAIACGVLASSTVTAAARECAPFFSLRDLAGAERTVDEYLGRVVLLNFWATTCAPCRMEMPDLESLYQSLKDRPFVVVAVSGDALGAPTVESFTREIGISFPVLLDPDSRVAARYGVAVRPVSYLIDREGKLVSRFAGLKEWTSADMSAQIEALLESAFPAMGAERPAACNRTGAGGQ